MTSSTFPAHWRAAVDRGDASGFTSHVDLIAFYAAVQPVYLKLSSIQKDNLHELDSMPACADAALEARMRAHARARAAETQAASQHQPRFIGVTNLARIPTLAECRAWQGFPFIRPWAKVVQRHNEERFGKATIPARHEG
ncbi:hypothetical protein [Mesorhizobium sp. M1396]|uniref:hypothetical protein n=1 Tax=Mesorhizobium sp. M1396 TaxID=2957095 RepID=UPI00333B95E2